VNLGVAVGVAERDNYQVKLGKRYVVLANNSNSSKLKIGS